MAEIHKFVPITKAKNVLLELIRPAQKADSTIAVTKNSVPTAVILSSRVYWRPWIS